jgi:hypothetical protein
MSCMRMCVLMWTGSHALHMMNVVVHVDTGAGLENGWGSKRTTLHLQQYQLVKC